MIMTGQFGELTSPHGDQKQRRSDHRGIPVRNRSKNSLALMGIRNIYACLGQPKTISTRPSLALMGIRNLAQHVIGTTRSQVRTH